LAHFTLAMHRVSTALCITSNKSDQRLIGNKWKQEKGNGSVTIFKQPLTYFSLLPTLVAPTLYGPKGLLHDAPPVVIELGMPYFCMFLRLTLCMFSPKFCPQIELHNQLHPQVGHQAPELLFCEITNKSALTHKISYIYVLYLKAVSKRTNIESHAVKLTAASWANRRKLIQNWELLIK